MPNSNDLKDTELEMPDIEDKQVEVPSKVGLISKLKRLPADLWLGIFDCLIACVLSIIANNKLGSGTIEIDVTSDGFKLFAVYLSSFLVGLVPIASVVSLIFDLVALKFPTKLVKIANTFTIMMISVLFLLLFMF